MDKSAESLVVLREFDNLIQAEIAKSMLDSAGIYCSLYDEYMSSFYNPIAFPSRLMVKKQDFDEAEKLLDCR
jgi:hypothetical protein